MGRYAMSDSVQVALITAGFPLIAAMAALLIPMFFKQRKQTEIIREQVANSHKSNLRDDIDLVIKLVETVRDDVANLRADVAWERRERMDDVRRLEAKAA